MCALHCLNSDAWKRHSGPGSARSSRPCARLRYRFCLPHSANSVGGAAHTCKKRRLQAGVASPADVATRFVEMPHRRWDVPKELGVQLEVRAVALHVLEREVGGPES